MPRRIQYISMNTKKHDDDRSRGNGSYSYPLKNAPENTPEETERVERLVERVLEEHSETIKKLADE